MSGIYLPMEYLKIKETDYEVVDAEARSEISTLKDKKVTDTNGVHGIRYNNDKLQVNENNTWTDVTAGESGEAGDVTGPASAQNNNVVTFDGTTGKVIKDSGFTIATSVPSGAVFTDTDTHHTSNTYVGASSSAKANAAASNGSVYLNHVENSTVRNAHKITGSGITAVTSDSSGNITVTTPEFSIVSGKLNITYGS